MSNLKYTIIVSHYNQYKFIYETLDSILNQDYESFQLLIFDDASTYFNTNVINEYITLHKPSLDFEIIVNEKNLGTVQTIKKILPKIKGKFVSFIAADDILFDSTVISSNVKFIEEKSCKIAASKTLMMDSFLEKTVATIPNVDFKYFNDLSSLEQLEIVMAEEIFGAGSVVYDRDTLVRNFKKIESKLIEDWPLHLNILMEGNQIQIADHISLKHRDGGISSVNGINSRANNDILKIYHKIIFKFFKDFKTESKNAIIQKYSYFLNNTAKYNKFKYFYFKILYKLNILPKR